MKVHRSRNLKINLKNVGLPNNLKQMKKMRILLKLYEPCLVKNQGKSNFQYGLETN